MRESEQLLIDVDLNQPELLLHVVDNGARVDARAFEQLRVAEDGLMTPVGLEALCAVEETEQTRLVDDFVQYDAKEKHMRQESYWSECDEVHPVKKWRTEQAERLKKKGAPFEMEVVLLESLRSPADAEEAHVIARWRVEAVEKLQMMKNAHKALVEKNKAKNRCVSALCGCWKMASFEQ